MPRATRSSSRPNQIEEEVTPKKSLKKQVSSPSDHIDVKSPTKSSIRPTRKNPSISPQTPRSSKRQKTLENKQDSDEESVSTPSEVSAKKSSKSAKASGDKTSPKNSRSSARINATDEQENQIRSSRSQKNKAETPINQADSNKCKTTSSRKSKRLASELSFPETPTVKKKATPKVTPKYRGKRTRQLDDDEDKNESFYKSEEEKSEQEDAPIEPKRIKTEPLLIRYKSPLPKRLSRVELYDEALKTLANKLNMFDLTDPNEATNVWCDWPSEDGPPSIKDVQNILLRRSWYSGNSRSIVPNVTNGNNVTNIDESKSCSNREIGVISYCLSHLSSDSYDIEIQKASLEKELSMYKTDIYCFQNVESGIHDILKNVLKSQGCNFSNISGNNLIAFQQEKFTVLSQRKVSAMDFANQVVHECAYPVTWCESIKEALSSSNFDEMLVLMLFHKASKQITMVASHSLLPSASINAFRPDITALNVTGALWNLARIWHEESTNEAVKNGRIDNSNSELASNGHEDGKNVSNGIVDKNVSSIAPRWLLCGPFNATERSPIYQLAKDGYPNDQTLDRLRCLKTVRLPTRLSLHVPPIDPEDKNNSDVVDTNYDKSFRNKSLIDLLWNAFQHPCTDVVSCYQAVVGREPPFTRLTGNLNLFGSPMDYIWCSGSTLKPQTVLLPPCRSLAAVMNSKQTNCAQNQPKSAIPLLAKMHLVPTAS